MELKNRDSRYNQIRQRVFEIIQIGNVSDLPSKVVDIILAISIILNISAVFLETFDTLEPYYGLFTITEYVTVVIFTVEYILRLWTADYLYPEKENLGASILRFVFSLSGIIDLCCFLPFYLPFFFPSGIVAFRILRVIRIFRLLRINAYYDAFNVILDVINEKKNELLSAVFIIMILMMASSMIMYNLEHEAQPEAFKNAFSGIWWSVSTMLTVGYGDIYPVTTAGQIVAILLAFLGVGLVAIPTGIISAGFVEQWTKVKNDRLSPDSSAALNGGIEGTMYAQPDLEDSKPEFRPLRRTKKAISDEETVQLLKNEKRGILSVNGDGGYPYAVPVDYLYDAENNRIYIHGSKVGHKLEAIKRDDKVCFTVFGGEEHEDGDWAPYFKSAVIFGRCHLPGSLEYTTEATRALAKKYYPSDDEIEKEIAKDIHGVQLYEIEIEHMCGKRIHEK